MLVESLKTLFNRDLNKLQEEIELYKNEANLWKIEKGISNSAGNLCLHLIGNLNSYIGSELGKTDYIRNRDLEFSLINVSKAELLNRIEKTKVVVNNALEVITSKKLDEEYPLLVFENKTTTAFFLIHLSTHLAYHLGQINYHRRLLDS
ncbi:DUF1572 family protein [Flavobacterium weaverense]|uniref:Uncharacterized protein DUF1572 n=1 Tax=Flavobacterium weaverense TaxID=271156 RepID=A0A3L9ZIG3_9FLAO|nr:DUF1572 family protein [Flavobacterium weaverense]RMA72761.1 uncharacterized protein DUF1572 [Flavobacterium weaverense]